LFDLNLSRARVARQPRYSVWTHYENFHIMKLPIGTALLRRSHRWEFRRTVAALQPCAVLTKKSFALRVPYQSLHSHLLTVKWCEGDSGPPRRRQEIEIKNLLTGYSHESERKTRVMASRYEAMRSQRERFHLRRCSAQELS
jgi:hypothetical protein